MIELPLELAFARLGVADAGSKRPLCATAQDGSLVVVCQSSGFSRPGVGVLRYSASLAGMTATRARIGVLRTRLEGACAERTPIRLIIKTAGVGGRPDWLHPRADLIGSITAFDGNAYSIDFVKASTE